MRPVRPKWSGAILLCTQQRDSNVSRASCGETVGSELRKWLRDRLCEAGMKDTILPVSTGCLGVCSRHGSTVALMPSSRSGMSRDVFVVGRDVDREGLWNRICAVLVDDSST